MPGLRRRARAGRIAVGKAGNGRGRLRSRGGRWVAQSYSETGAGGNRVPVLDDGIGIAADCTFGYMRGTHRKLA